MHVLSIDLGSYSVKYLSSYVDRRKVIHSEMSEVVISDFLSDHPEQTIEEAQANIIHEIIDSVARPDSRIIFQADHSMMTTRFLTLPVKSRKKAVLMLPFQLEEDIPFSLSEIHYAFRIDGQKTQHTALVELVQESKFENFYNLYQTREILPNILTTEPSIVENYFNGNPMAGPFCVVDIGHKTTKAHFFYNSRLLITHVSYMGGEHINEMIAQTYKIDMDEAIIYKHKNAFLLTSSQYDEVEEAQREFAKAMDRTFNHLVTDFTRWKIGFKVNYGLSIQHIYICGGTANIKNITNFLTEKWGTKVALFDGFEGSDVHKLDLNPKNKSKFALSAMMANGFKRKNRFINLLSGKFAQASSAEFPLHSFSYLGIRVAAVSLVLLLSLFVERIFIQREIGQINSKISSLVKNNELNIGARLRRTALSSPKPVYDFLQKKHREITQEISTLQSAVEIQALALLVLVSQISASAKNATLIEFKSSETKEIYALFSSDSLEELKNLKSSFEKSILSEVTANIDESAKQLTITAVGN